MNSIERRSTDNLKSLLESETFLDIVNKTLEVAESCVSLVAMIYLLCDAELLQSEDTTDTEKDFLLQTVLPVTTIEGVSDRTVIVRVHIIISIEQIEFYTTYVSLPYEGMNHVVHIRNINNHLIAVLIESTCDRQGCEILSIIVSYLLTIHREGLLEVSETV